MTATQHAPRPTVEDSPATLSAVRRAARALKHVHDEQVVMWEAFWQAGRFPVDHR